MFTAEASDPPHDLARRQAGAAPAPAETLRRGPPGARSGKLWADGIHELRDTGGSHVGRPWRRMRNWVSVQCADAGSAQKACVCV